MKLTGIGASSGIAMAKTLLLKEVELDISKDKVSDKGLEKTKLKRAIDDAIDQIKKIKTQAAKNLEDEEIAVFDAHIQVASDPSIASKINEMIDQDGTNAIYATKVVMDDFANLFSSMDDPYMRERAVDIQDVAKRILYSLSGLKIKDLSTINQQVIIVANDLTPSQTALLNKKYVKGFLTDIGGRTSHAAIMARSLEIPAILGLKNITQVTKDGDFVAIDGDTGEVLINPSSSEVKSFDVRIKEFNKDKAENIKFKGRKSLTSDGHHVELAANIGRPGDVEGANDNDAEGVGLFRSEFLYMDAENWPTEKEQYQAYAEVLKNMHGKRVVVRTLDIGGDKTLSYYKFPQEMNPFLGYRAIRLSLDKKDVFATQIRALLRASVHGKLAIMFPMIATVDEFLQAKKFTLKIKDQLLSEKIKVADDIEIGMMVEVPAAAVLAQEFAKHADFFSIGTNDLMQYTMAADRMSEKVSYLYQPLNPSILHMINMTIKGAHAHGKWVGMCGEMAGDKMAIPLLLGMGLDEFSMAATSILGARRAIANIDKIKAINLVQKALNSQTQKQVHELVKEFMDQQI